MDVLWASGQPLSLSALIRQSPQRSWKDRSAFSILNGLLKRGLIYEAEQAALSVRVAELTATLEQAEEKTNGAERFLRLVRRYTEVEELTPEIVNEFIERIEVHAPDKSSGHRQQKIDILYNFVGLFEPPTAGKEEERPIALVNSVFVA